MIGSAIKEDESMLAKGKPLLLIPHAQGRLHLAVGLALLCGMTLQMSCDPYHHLLCVQSWWKGWVNILLEFLGVPKDSRKFSEYSESRAPSTQDRCWQLY